MARLTGALVVLALTVAPLPPARAGDDAAALLKRGETALAEGAVHEAADLFQKARKLDPAVAPEADWGLARAALARGDRKKAVALADALARVPGSPQRLAAVLLLKGLALSKSDAPGELDDAEAAFRAAAEAAPASPAPLYNLGVLQVTRGRTEEGLGTGALPRRRPDERSRDARGPHRAKARARWQVARP
jgi:Flp pilus assembly protein TadD